MATILVLEDDETISFGVKAGLELKGHNVICCSNVKEARASVSGSTDLALLDWNLPDGSGYSFCRELKASGNISVIFMTVRDSEADIVNGLNAGADDYIVKPFKLSVLSARISAVLRRSSRNKPDKLLKCGGIVLDLDKTEVLINDEEIALSVGEYRLLSVLMANKNLTLTRAALLEKLWDAEGNFVNDNTLTVTVKRLREKLGSDSSIRTLRGIGYRMEDTL